MVQSLVRSLFFGLTFILSACAGDGDATGVDDADAPVREILSNPAFGENIQEIFDRRGCSATSCHGAATAANLDLRAGAAFGNLVNVVAFGDAAFQRVKPNDAQNSYLVLKLEGRQTVGARMPLNGPALDNIDLTNIRNWIDTGAPNN